MFLGGGRQPCDLRHRKSADKQCNLRQREKCIGKKKYTFCDKQPNYVSEKCTIYDKHPIYVSEKCTIYDNYLNYESEKYTFYDNHV